MISKSLVSGKIAQKVAATGWRAAGCCGGLCASKGSARKPKDISANSKLHDL